jgi:hypothetical protein
MISLGMPCWIVYVDGKPIFVALWISECEADECYCERPVVAWSGSIIIDINNRDLVSLALRLYAFDAVSPSGCR